MGPYVKTTTAAYTVGDYGITENGSPYLQVANGGTGCGAPSTFANLPGSPTAGTICNVTDSSVGCVAGTPVTAGGGATKCQVTWDGSNWQPGGGVASAAAGGLTTAGTGLNASPANTVNLTTPVAVANGGTGVTTAQGNGSKVQLSTGTTTTNDCVKFDANGNTVDFGAACGSGGSGTVNSGTAQQLGFYATTGTVISGTNYVPSPTVTAVSPNQNTVVSTSCSSSLTPKTIISTTGDAQIFEFNSSASGTGAPVAPTINTVSGWTRAVQNISTDLTNDTEIWYILNQTASTSATGPTITLNAGTPGTGGACQIGVNIGDYSNVNTSSALDVTATAKSTTAAITSIAFSTPNVTLTMASNPFTTDGTSIKVADSPTSGNNGTFTTVSHTGTTVTYSNASGAACASSCGIAVIPTLTLTTGTTAATAQANELVIASTGYQPPAVGNSAAVGASSFTPTYIANGTTELSDPQPGIAASANLYPLEGFQTPTATGTQNETWTLSGNSLEYTGAIATFKVSTLTRGALTQINKYPENLAGLALTSNSVDYACAPNHTDTTLCAGTCVYATNTALLPSAGGAGSGGINQGQLINLEPPSGYLGYQWHLEAQIDNTQNNTPLAVPFNRFQLTHLPGGSTCSGCTWQESVSPEAQAAIIPANGWGQMSLSGTGAAVGNPHIPSNFGRGELMFSTQTAARACVQMTLTVWTLPIRYGFNPTDMFNGSNSFGVAGIVE